MNKTRKNRKTDFFMASKRSSRALKKRAFTLIELLIAIALTMVLGWLISLAFSNTSQASKTVTSTLDYHSKGRMLMEQIASDITDTVRTTEHTLLSGDPFNGYELKFKTHLTRLRSRYGDGNFGEGKNFSSDVVAVRWKSYDNVEIPTKGSKFGLYRQIAPSPSVIAAEDQLNEDKNKTVPGRNTLMKSLLTGVKPVATPPYDPPVPDPLAVTNADLVTMGDIREFKITASLTAQDGIPDYYTVSFYLTNAPESIATRAADTDGTYMWVRFMREIRTR